ncbi:hypothetical protein F5050DRAFT_1780254 [Lentinula boryana]|uniref:Uncharacterized protein n=1 Tax=Lentinula boryana TaxID=40481 RepID=A0ABQ8Q4J3_9AGAR|nr:hypothetical protein F5050DRAFT_1780254 [Lentinula boryana]
MRPMCFHTIHLTRDISETLTGAYARRHPLNETKIPTHFDSFYIQVRSMASQAALEVATSLEEVPSTLSRLTHMNYSDLRKWPTFVLEDAIELNVAQRVWALERFRDGLSLTGFSWVDRTDTVEAHRRISCLLHARRDHRRPVFYYLATNTCHFL